MSTYNPPRFQGKDRSEALDFISVNSFAAVITVFENNPTISQLPLTIEVRGDDIFLIGHLAKQNPHANIISKSKVTVLFHGAHTYITPVWYAENDVPTWNYSSVQVTGDVELIEDNQGLIDCLQVLTTDTEKKYPSGWNFFIPDARCFWVKPSVRYLSDYLKQHYHVEIIANVLFSQWLRLSVLYGVSEQEWQKMDHYFPEILEAIRNYLRTLR